MTGYRRQTVTEAAAATSWPHSVSQPTCSGSPIRSAHRYASKFHRHFDARYGTPSDVLVLSRSVFSIRDRMEAISATARIHHTSCRHCPYWTVDGYRSETQGLPPRYADRGSADESRERGCRGAHRRADAARLHTRGGYAGHRPTAGEIYCDRIPDLSACALPVDQ